MTAHPHDKPRAHPFPPAGPSASTSSSSLAAIAAAASAAPHPTNKAPTTFSKSTMHGGPPATLHSCRSSLSLNSMEFTPLNVVTRGLTKNVSLLSLTAAAHHRHPAHTLIHATRASSALVSQPEGLTMALAALLQDDVYAGDRTSSSTTPPTANDVNAIPSSPTATSSSSPTSNMTVFHALEAPSISVRDYVHRLSKYAFCSPACLITAMYYMSRVVDTHANLALTSLTVHRLLITALVLACKYLDDMNYNLSYYAKVGGLPTKELANLELHMLRMLDFHLGIPVHLFNHLEATLVSRVAKLANQPHYPHQNTNVNDFGGDPPCVVDRLPTDEPMQTQKVHQRQSPNHSPRQQQQQQQPNPATEIAMGSDDGGVVAAVAADRTAIHLANKAVALLDGDLVERFASLFDDLETAGLGSPSSSSGGSDISHVAALLYSQTISMHQHGGVTSTCPRLMVNNNNNNNGNAAPNDNNSTAEHAAAQMLQQQQGKSGKGLPPTSPVSDSLSRNSSTDTLAMAAATIISGGGSGNVPVGAIAMQTTRPADDGVGKGDNNAGGGGGRRTTLAKPTRRRSSGSGQLRLLGGAGRDMSCRVDGQNSAHRPSGNTPPLQRRVSFSSSKK